MRTNVYDGRIVFDLPIHDKLEFQARAILKGKRATIVLRSFVQAYHSDPDTFERLLAPYTQSANK